MGTIYQLTFFLALGLLAIVITIFVFAVSLLGRAIEAAARSEKDKLAERKASNVEEMAAIRQEIQEAETSGQIPKGLRRKLDKLEKKDKKFEKELGKIRKAPEPLTVRGGVFYPCASLIAALVLNGGALFLSNIQNIHWAIPLSVWILGLATIGYSIYRMCKSLKVIQSVATPSEEVAFKRETEAFKSALKELEEERRPELMLEFRDTKPPFHIGKDEEFILRYRLSLMKGDIGRKPRVYFCAPSGFSFLDVPTGAPPLDERYTTYTSACWVESDEDIIRGTFRNQSVKFKTPSQSQSYPLIYRLFCESFASDYEEFEVIVE